jgi:integrase
MRRSDNDSLRRGPGLVPGPHVLPANERVTDGARTRDLLETTIRRYLFPGVARCRRIGLDKLISLLAAARRFWVLRAEWCQDSHRLVVTRCVLEGQAAVGVLPSICFHHLRHTCATAPALEEASSPSSSKDALDAPPQP